ncbi:peptidoglycan-binding protein [Chelativorans sp. YIM 93263]|uniref:peptidoglycan-binding protein n=1 Tax=Chelativorans sp. YIM 93263 TaxID=2906648 RepID=UPI0023784C06|nr:peptidoglycan-binding protein [Chelativorans sp. YIM 93263]
MTGGPMTAYERQPERRIGVGAMAGAALAAVGRFAARNPAAVGGTTAFVVALSFVSANAVWYQPQSHPGAFVATREQPFIPPAPQPAPEPRPAEAEPANGSRSDVRQIAPEQETANVEPRPEPQSTGSVNPTGGDPTVRSAQGVLKELGLYDGEVDGMIGPQTRAAVENYRRIVGLEIDGGIDSALLEQLGLESQETAVPAVAPTPIPRPELTANRQAEPEPAVPEQEPAPTQEPEPASAREQRRVSAPGSGSGADLQMASLNNADPTVRRVQAGLRAFGNDGIEVDGVLGKDTQDAIREFQSLFGLSVTGQPDDEFLAKMREVGLIN